MQVCDSPGVQAIGDSLGELLQPAASRIAKRPAYPLFKVWRSRFFMKTPLVFSMRLERNAPPFLASMRRPVAEFTKPVASGSALRRMIDA
jgi:hypothetical protein